MLTLSRKFNHKAVGIGCACSLTAMLYAADRTYAQDRPLFQAPFSCGQVWYASTYKRHWPDADSLDLVERNSNLKIISKGQPILASAAGRVTANGEEANGEHRLYIDHGNGWETFYVHMDPDSSANMWVGRRVAQGEQIGKASNSGTASVHLHYTQATYKNTAHDQDSDGTWKDGGSPDCCVDSR